MTSEDMDWKVLTNAESGNSSNDPSMRYRKRSL